MKQRVMVHTFSPSSSLKTLYCGETLQLFKMYQLILLVKQLKKKHASSHWRYHDEKNNCKSLYKEEIFQCNGLLQSWARIPGFAFPHSRVPGVLGTRARGNVIFFKARGNAEREEVGTLISRA